MLEDNSTSVEPVQVFIRIRPENSVDDFLGERENFLLSPKRKSSNQSSPLKGKVTSGNRPDFKCVTTIDDNTLRLSQPDGTHLTRKASVTAVDDKIFAFDKIFTDSKSQEDIYNSVSPHVRATVRGYNTTIFAYGNTGSGKTFTMTGTSAAPGVIPRAISEIFSIIEATAAQERDVFFYVRLSYVELYNNTFRNLLEFASKELSQKDLELSKLQELDSSTNSRSTSPTTMHPGINTRSDKIEVRESQSAGVFLAGQNLRIPVTTAQEAFQLIARGNKLRAVGSTMCNETSSRSHAILTLHVESRISAPLTTSTTEPISELRLGKMHLVDLAGSERVTLSGAEGDTLVETQNINLSLSALGDVLSALSKNAAAMAMATKARAAGKPPPPLVPVPYRNSKLTHLLKDSLGGNSKTIMIATVRTLPDYYQQTVVTLTYASRAKKVRNRSLINRDVIGDTGIHAVTTEIERLKTRLDERSVEFDRLRLLHLKDAKENSSLKHRLQQLNEANELEKLQLEAQMSHVIHSQAGQLATQRQKISELQKSLENELAVSQNRIVEQEKEIKWLKRALDESSQAAQQPIEQLSRMQQVLDAWQLQANDTQQNLAAAMRQIDELKLRNTTLLSEAKSSQLLQRRLQSDVAEKIQTISQLNQTLTECQQELSIQLSEKETLQKDHTRLLEKSHVDTQATANQLKDTRIKLKLSEESFLTLQQQHVKLQSELKSLSESYDKKMLLLVEEKKEMWEKCHSNIGSLEQNMSQALSDAASKLQQTDVERRRLEEKTSSLENTIAELQIMVESAKQKEVSLLQSHRSTIQETTQKFSMEINTLKNDFQIAVTQEREMLLNQHASEITALKSQWESERLVANQSDLQQLLATQKKQWTDQLNSTLQKSNNEHEEEINKIKSSMHHEIEELKKLKSEYEKRHYEEMNQALLQQQQQLERRQLEEIQNLSMKQSTAQALHLQAIADCKAKYEEQLRQSITMHKKKIEETLHEKAVAVAAAESAAALRQKELVQEFQSQLQEELRNGLQAQRKKLADKHSKELEELRHELQSTSECDLRDRLDQVQRQLRTEVQAAVAEERDCQEARQREVIEAHQRDFQQQLESELNNIRSHYEMELIRKDDNYQLTLASTLEETKATYQSLLEKEISRQQVEFQETLREEKEKYETLLQTTLAEQRQEFQSSSLKEKLLVESEREKERCRNDEEVEQLCQRHEEQLRSLQSDWENRLSANQHQERLQHTAAMESLQLKLETDHKKEVESLRRKHSKALSALEKRLCDEYASEKNSSLSDLRQQLQQHHKQEMEQAVSSLQQQLQETYQIQIEEAVQASLAKKHQEVTLALQEVRQQYETMLTDKLNDQRIALEKERDDQMNKLGHNHATILAEKDEELRRLSLRHEERLEVLRGDHSRELASLRQDHAEFRSCLSAERASQLEALEQRYIAMSDKDRQLAENRWVDRENQLQQQHKQEMEQAVSSLQQQLQETYQIQVEEAVQASLAKKHQEVTLQLQEVRQQYETMLTEKLNDQRIACEKERVLLVNSMNAEADTLTKKLSDMKSTHEESLYDLKSSHEQQLATVRLEWEARLAQLQQVREAELTKSLQFQRHQLEQEKERCVTELELQHRQQLLEKEEAVQQLIADIEINLQHQHKQEMEEAVSSLQQQLQETYQIQVEEAVQASLAKKHQEVTLALQEVQQQYETMLTEKLNDQRIDYERERDETTAIFTTEKERLENKIQSKESQHTQQLHQLQQSHREELEALHEDYEFRRAEALSELKSDLDLDRVEQLQALEDHIRYRRESDARAAAEELLRLERNLKETYQSTLQVKLQELRSELDSTKEREFEELVLQNKSRIDDLILKHQAELMEKEVNLKASLERQFRTEIDILQQEFTDQILRQKESASQEIMELIAAHQEREEKQAQQLQLAVTEAIRSKECEYNEKILSLSSQNEKRFLSQQSDFESRLESQRSSWVLESNTLAKSYEEDMEQLITRHQQELASLQSDWENKVLQIQQDASSEQQASIDKYDQQLQQSLEASIERHQSALSSAVTVVRSQLEAQYLSDQAIMAKQFEADIQAREETLASSLAEQQQLHQTAMAELQNTLQSKYQQHLMTELSVQKDDFEKMSFTDLEKLQRFFSSFDSGEHPSAEWLSTLKLSSSIEVGAKLIDLCNNLEIKNSQRITTALSTQRSELESKFLSQLAEKDHLLQQYQNQLMSMHTSTSDDIKSALNEQLEQLLNRHQTDVESMRNERLNIESKYASEIHSLMEFHTKEMTSQRRLFEESNDKLLSVLSKDLEESKLRYSSLTDSIENERKEFTNKMNELELTHKAQLHEMMAKLEENQTSIKLLQSQHQLEVEALVVTHSQTEGALQESLSRLELDYQSLKELHEHSIALAETTRIAYESESQAVTEQHRQELLTQQDRYELEIQRLSLLIENNESRLVTLQELIDTSKTAENQLLSQCSELEKALTLSRNGLTDALGQLQLAQQQYDSAIASESAKVEAANHRLAELLQEYESKELLNESRRLELVTAAESQLSQLESEVVANYQSQIEILQNELLENESRHRNDLLAQESEYQSATEQRVQRLTDSLTASHNEELTSLQNNHNLLIKSKEDEVTIKLSENEERLVELRSSHLEELSLLQEGFQGERQQYQLELQSERERAARQAEALQAVQREREQLGLCRDSLTLELQTVTQEKEAQCLALEALRLEYTASDKVHLSLDEYQNMESQSKLAADLQQRLILLQSESASLHEEMAALQFSHSRQLTAAALVHREEMQTLRSELSRQYENEKSDAIACSLKLQESEWQLTLQTQLSQLEAEITTNYQSQIEILQNELLEKDSSHRNDLLAQESKYQSATEEKNQQQQREQQSLRSELEDRHKNDLKDLQVQLEERYHQSLTAEIEKEKAAAEARHSHLSSLLQSKEDLIINLAGQHIDSLSQQQTALQSQFEATLTQLSAQNDATVNELKRQLQSSEQQLEESRSRYRILKDDLEALVLTATAERERNEMKLRQLQSDNDELRRDASERNTTAAAAAAAADSSSTSASSEWKSEYLQPLRQQLDDLIQTLSRSRADNQEAAIKKMEELHLQLLEHLPKSSQLPPPSSPLSPPMQAFQEDWNDTIPYDQQDNYAETTTSKSSLWKGNNSTSISSLKVQSRKSKPNESNEEQTADSSPQSLPPSSRSSPVDQLVAAVLDGDVQGVRSVIRSRGGDLTADYWRDCSRSILPLHRAVSGLHFHGSERQLVATLEALIQLGADVTAADQAGNTVLHKALQICTSKSVTAVTRSLLARGVPVMSRNRAGDTALHTECRRIRSASLAVIQSLLTYGCDVNSVTRSTTDLSQHTASVTVGTSAETGRELFGGYTPLSLILKQLSAGQWQPTEPSSSSTTTTTTAAISRSSTAAGYTYGNASTAKTDPRASKPSSPPLPGSSSTDSVGRSILFRAIELLLNSGAKWDPKFRDACQSQLHLLLDALPVVSSDESQLFWSIFQRALKAGCDVTASDHRGCNVLFVLCEKFLEIPASAFPEASKWVRLVLDRFTLGSSMDGIGGSDKTGRTIFDLHETVPGSCYSAVKHMLSQAAEASVLGGDVRVRATASRSRGNSLDTRSEGRASPWTDTSSTGDWVLEGREGFYYLPPSAPVRRVYSTDKLLVSSNSNSKSNSYAEGGGWKGSGISRQDNMMTYVAPVALRGTEGGVYDRRVFVSTDIMR